MTEIVGLPSPSMMVLRVLERGNKSTHTCSTLAIDKGWQWWYSYWHKQWGFSREDDPKGIVVILLGGP